MRFASPRRRSAQPLALLAALALFVSACTGDSSNLEDLAETLTEVTDLTEEQADCVAAELRANPAYDEDLVTDLGDGTADTEAGEQLQEQFEQDVASAVTLCLQSS